MALISVIVPVYNVAPYLRRCLESILAQTFNDFEAICINDGSTDNSLDILRQYTQKDKRIIIFNQENMGLSAARNAGLREAKGKYITFIDSDDFVAPEFLKCLYEAIINSGADISGCDFFKIKNNYQAFKPCVNPKTKIFDDALGTLLDKRNFIHFNVWNKLYKREVLNGVWFVEGIYFEDWVFNTIVFSKANAFAWIEASLYGYRISDNSIMRSSFSQKKIDDYAIGIHFVYDFYLAHYPALLKQVKAKSISRVLKTMINHTLKTKDVALVDYAAKTVKKLFAGKLIGYPGLSLANKVKLYRFLHRRGGNGD